MPRGPPPSESGRRGADKQGQSLSSSKDDIGGKGQEDLEKQTSEHEGELEHMATRRSTIQAIPGVRLEEDDGMGYESREGSDGEGQRQAEGVGEDGGRGGLAGVLDRAVSRVSTKSSWNPGPPPDGGGKAWTAGQYPEENMICWTGERFGRMCLD